MDHNISLFVVSSRELKDLRRNQTFGGKRVLRDRNRESKLSQDETLDLGS